MTKPTALTIAGSDSSGGAGIQADLKTMVAFHVYGTSAITSITAQNTFGVRASLHLPPALIGDQIDAVMEDVGADAAKTGMLATVAIIEAVSDAVRRHAIRNLVVDHVMVATSGARLIEDEAIRTMSETMLPLAYVVTPNVPEAEILSGIEIASVEDMEGAARAIHGLGPANVLVKGGHLAEGATDVLFDGRELRRLDARRLPVGKVHGTGCALSAAIASGLARGWAIGEAVTVAKDYVTGGIASAFRPGRGGAVVDHSTRPRDPGQGTRAPGEGTPEGREP